MYSLTFQRNATRAPTANPPNTARLGGILYHTPKLHPGPCNSVDMRSRTDTQAHKHTDRPTEQTHRRVWPQHISRRVRLTRNVIIALPLAITFVVQWPFS